MRRWVIGVLGIWRGEGWGEGWNRGGQFTSNLRPRWTPPKRRQAEEAEEEGGEEQGPGVGAGQAGCLAEGDA